MNSEVLGLRAELEAAQKQIFSLTTQLRNVEQENQKLVS